ncbi:uncharacterized protein [Drosophila pseudoobscura]|uniref:Uncharacterized protein n=1 Tax=Drosophila pseudoobscura pseudoobscura TaxID=46245 RepID=A0A6I8WAC8_DROPS|nr:uncharacterized protein LOC117184775 [Drosophila pseudoobscura]
MPTGEKKSRKKFKRVSSLSLTHPPSSNGSIATPTSSRPAPTERGPTTSRAHAPHAFEALLLPSVVPRTVPSTMAQSAASSARSKFALAASRLTRFDQKLSAPDASTPTRSLSQVHRDQLRSLWANWPFKCRRPAVAVFLHVTLKFSVGTISSGPRSETCSPPYI